MNMNKKIIGFFFAVVSVSLSCSFAMSGSYYGSGDLYGAPNDPNLIEYYLAIFKQEEDKRRLEQEQARAKKEQKQRVPSHDDQMQEYAARHKKKLAELEKSGQVVVVAQQSDSQGVGDEVVGVEDLVDSLTNSIQGFVISTKKESKKSKAKSQIIGNKRDQDSRPVDDDCNPKRRPLPELFEEVLNLHEENEEMEEGFEPVVVVIEQPLGQTLGLKRRNHDRDRGFDDPDAKRSKK